MGWVSKTKAATIFGREAFLKNEDAFIFDLLAANVVERARITSRELIIERNTEILPRIERQLFDLLFAIGQYTLVSMFLNTVGVQLEDGAEGFPT